MRCMMIISTGLCNHENIEVQAQQERPSAVMLGIESTYDMYERAQSNWPITQLSMTPSIKNNDYLTHEPSTFRLCTAHSSTLPRVSLLRNASYVTARYINH